MAQCLAILAPTGRDAEVVSKILASSRIASLRVSSAEALLDCISEGKAGAAIIAEEALSRSAVADLETWLGRQPPWSDLPIILLTKRRDVSGSQSML
jgi:hypothetical protein